MDKPSERKKDTKACGDTDIGVFDYDTGGKIARMNGLWDIAPKDVVGLSKARVLTNCYSKDDNSEKPNVIDEIMEGGPPLLNMSKPRRVF